MQNDAKFEEELTCRSKTDMGNLTILTGALGSLKNVHFDLLFLSRVYIV